MFQLTQPELQRIEKASIRAFVERAAAAGVLDGRTLDYGAGAEPYRDLVKGEYVPYDKLRRDDVILHGQYDAVLCTQVLQYIADPHGFLCFLANRLRDSGGRLVLTFPTNWYECETEDLWRFTAAGVRRMLSGRFDIEVFEPRASIQFQGFELRLGYGVIARVSGS